MKIALLEIASCFINANRKIGDCLFQKLAERNEKAKVIEKKSHDTHKLLPALTHQISKNVKIASQPLITQNSRALARIPTSTIMSVNDTLIKTTTG